MAKWESKTIKDVVEEIDEESFVLPVIQRRLVWDEPKMELLFDSLLKGNSFGGIMVLKEDKDSKPLFAFRRFSKHGEEHDSSEQQRLQRRIHFVIDGQQRLQTFYMGLKGTYQQKTLYFNLYSTQMDYEFKFAEQEAALRKYEPDDAGRSVPKLWYSVPELYRRLNEVHSVYQVAAEIASELGVEEQTLRAEIEANVRSFSDAILPFPAIGLSSVTVNKSRIDEERQRIVELFRRLNDGGTRLSSFDLVASIFKGFDHRMEKFFKAAEQFSDMRIFQDEVLKLVFLLQDNHSKEVTEITRADAEFVIANQERIIASLKGLRQFLQNAKLYKWYQSGGRSVIPLYFIAYHIFHKQLTTEKLESLYDNYDTNNPDFLRAKRWIYLSVLNGVFSRGCGWIPYLTGIRKILGVMKHHKNDLFPVDDIFSVYAHHPLAFSEAVTADRLDKWDRDFVLYLIYREEAMAGRDIDHIHPRSLLESSHDPVYEPGRINSVANFQYLDIGTNRGIKRAKSLSGWINGDVADRADYLSRHLIPSEESLWQVARFSDFLEKRSALIIERINANIPALLSDQNSERAIAGSDSAKVVTTPKLADHPLLSEEETWYQIYKNWGLGRMWPGRYRNELKKIEVKTVADLARTIMTMRLEHWKESGYGPIFRFHCNPADGRPLELNVSNFGAYAWHIALKELESRGFPWRDYLEA